MQIRVAAVLLGLIPAAAATQSPIGDQAPVATCPVPPAAPPPALAGWAARVPVTAAVDQNGLGAAMLVPGTGADVTLRPTPDVIYPLRPSHPGGSVSSGGLLAFDVAEAGTYRVAIGSGAWVEVVRNGAAVESTAHGRGPACTGIGKMVDFPLIPGRHLLEIAGNGTPSIAVLVTRLP